jgi:hypothetical protein
LVQRGVLLFLYYKGLRRNRSQRWL